MAHEILRKMPAQISLTEAGKSIFLPLYAHKRRSDKAGKHVDWSPKTHAVVNILAILTDAGLGAVVAILFFSGNRWDSARLKILHNAGAEIIPPLIANHLRKNGRLTNKSVL